MCIIRSIKDLTTPRLIHANSARCSTGNWIPLLDYTIIHVLSIYGLNNLRFVGLEVFAIGICASWPIHPVLQITADNICFIEDGTHMCRNTSSWTATPSAEKYCVEKKILSVSFMASVLNYWHLIVLLLWNKWI